MRGAGGDEKLLADFQPVCLTVHFEFFFAFHQHHQLVGFMDEVPPFSAGRVDPQVKTPLLKAPSGCFMMKG
jgi:hypothetical protein